MCKFNPQNFAYQSKFYAKLRPSMAGVRYENGYQVASNGYILCAVKESYPEEYEGKTVSKNGGMNDGRFPNWKSLIPNNTKNLTEVELDLAKFNECVKDAKALIKEKKIIRNRGEKSRIYIKVRDAYFKMELLEEIVSLMNHLGTNRLFLNGERRSAIVIENENYGLIMPCMSCYAETITDKDGRYISRVYTLA